MDIDTAWRDFLQHLIHDEREEARQGLRHIREWMNNHGFPPKGFYREEFIALISNISVGRSP